MCILKDIFWCGYIVSRGGNNPWINTGHLHCSKSTTIIGTWKKRGGLSGPSL